MYRCEHGTDWEANKDGGILRPAWPLQLGERVRYPSSPSDRGTITEVWDDCTSTVTWDDGGEMDPLDPRGRLIDMECGCSYVIPLLEAHVQWAEPRTENGSSES